jgi:hypothetical protein
MFGESGASGSNCIWSATLTQRHEQKQFVVKLKRRCQDRMQGASPGAARSFTICAQRTPACAERVALPPVTLDHCRTRYDAPHIAEG